ncbi:uncharacterized protein LOC113348806 isoform X2 [Papaver somniferum]|nr:uncharacterized protein LOC113348806 isoform X2 [Papaver somniferum]
MKFVDNLPFEVGQLIESKSFLEGYRGAWFRCKIKDYGKRCGEHNVALEYIDFPDEKRTWIHLYRQSPAERNLVSKRRHLMLRPSYPQIYHRNQMPDTCDISEIIAIVDGTWNVGDMVDWLTDGCYWSAWITNVQDEENVQIQLPEPPAGEGGSYVVPSKELRPSLDWTPELGWTVPISKIGATSRPCVRLIQRKSPGIARKDDLGTGEKSSLKLSSASVSSHSLAGSLRSEFSRGSSVSNIKKSSNSLETVVMKKHSGDMLHKRKTETSSIKNDGTETSFPDSVSSKSVSARNNVASREQYNFCGSSKKLRKSETELNSTFIDTIEASIMDLEELVNKVKWLKGALAYGVELSNAMKPSWKFVET